ncbi:hypothetical protein H7F36_00185 [Variovorax sp. PAMC28562]|uniref:hypothetical protein n=1 Tax=Variovorax sp. PAMC28562 TaxID=2762323 RepID=UPI00164E2C02|nr:hypothetical protein [Variovorax sp. PAMC28562]QNK73740.1 hypothetical protein H7F36_00185 [Variovorax sp. PAMC28562]
MYQQFLTPFFAIGALFAIVFVVPHIIPLLKLIPRCTFIGGFLVVAFCGFALLLTTPSVPGFFGTTLALSLGAWYAFGAVRHYRRLLAKSRSIHNQDESQTS